MDDAFLVRMLNAVADLDEQLEALADRQAVPIAVAGDRFTAHVLHHEVRATLRRRPGVEHLGDRRVVHQGQRLALGLETRHDLRGVHAGLDDLDRDLAVDGWICSASQTSPMPPSPRRCWRR